MINTEGIHTCIVALLYVYSLDSSTPRALQIHFLLCMSFPCLWWTKGEVIESSAVVFSAFGTKGWWMLKVNEQSFKVVAVSIRHCKENIDSSSPDECSNK